MQQGNRCFFLRIELYRFWQTCELTLVTAQLFLRFAQSFLGVLEVRSKFHELGYPKASHWLVLNVIQLSTPQLSGSTKL
jgi:hypothetical protein